MRTLNLIYPEQSDIIFSTNTFPDGQPHIRIDVASVNTAWYAEPLRIFSRINNPSDLLQVLFAKNTLTYMGFEIVELHVSYLMAARMDRVMLDGEPFSLKVVAQMINIAGFSKVKIFDPHSEVSTALIEKSYAVNNHAFVADALAHYFASHKTRTYSLVSPDAGALKKIHKLAAHLDEYEVIECSKMRDLKTGALTGFNTAADDLTGKICFIIDDICDGGGTFAGTAKMLKSKGASKVHLIVSHGIFSKGTKIEAVDDIYTTDSYANIAGVNCFSISKYLL